MTAPPLTRTLAGLAVDHPAASRVFQRHRLDFCCGGKRSLEEACRERAIDPAAILAEIEALERHAPPDDAGWAALDLPTLVDRIEAVYHEDHRAELPELFDMARKVEAVHRDHPAVPRGLATHLAALAADLEMHMKKEEQVLFPMIRSGAGAACQGPIRVMEAEHEDAAAALERTRTLTGDLVPPEGACTTWRALYLRLESFERKLMEHAGLENNVLFPRALRQGS